MRARNLKVLIIDDEKQDRVLLINKLNRLTNYVFEIDQMNSSKSALETLNSNDYDVVFLDFLMGDATGLEVLMNLEPQKKAETPIILTTGYGNSLVREDSQAIGAKYYLDKNDINEQSLDNAISEVLAA